MEWHRTHSNSRFTWKRVIQRWIEPTTSWSRDIHGNCQNTTTFYRTVSTAGVLNSASTKNLVCKTINVFVIIFDGPYSREFNWNKRWLRKQLQLSRIHLGTRGIMVRISFLVLSSLTIISQGSDLNIDTPVRASPLRAHITSESSVNDVPNWLV